jgi:hypothetical protein
LDFFEHGVAGFGCADGVDGVDGDVYFGEGDI